MTVLDAEGSLWMCRAAAATYVVTALGVTIGRAWYDRRRRLIARIEPLVAGLEHATGAEQRDGRERLAALLHRCRTSVLTSVVADATASLAARRAAAHALAARVGLPKLRSAAVAPKSGQPAWRRIQALQVLAFTNVEEAWACLREALVNGCDEVRVATVTLLGQLPDRRAGRLLVDALQGNQHARSRVATAIDAFPLPLGDLIVPLLVSDDPYNRYWGALLLRRYPDIAAQEGALGRLVTDSEALVRKAALETIGICRLTNATALVEARLNDRVAFVRAHAARAAGHLGDARAVPALLNLLADRDWWVRSAAKESLERMGSSVIAPLTTMLTHPDAFARNGAAEVLQNLGAIEELVWSPRPASGASADIAQLLAQAGGSRMWDAIVMRHAALAGGQAVSLAH